MPQHIRCHECGAPLSKTIVEIQIGTTIKCPKCSHANKVNTEAPVSTGKSQRPRQAKSGANTQPVPEEPKDEINSAFVIPNRAFRNKKKEKPPSNLPWILGAVGVVVLGATLILFLNIIRNKDKPAEESQAADKTSESEKRPNRQSSVVVPPPKTRIEVKGSNDPSGAVAKFDSVPKDNLKKYASLIAYLPESTSYIAGRDFEAMRQTPWFWDQYRRQKHDEMEDLTKVLGVGGLPPDNWIRQVEGRTRNGSFIVIAVSKAFDLEAFRSKFDPTTVKAGDFDYYKRTIRIENQTCTASLFVASADVVVYSSGRNASVEANQAAFQALVAESNRMDRISTGLRIIADQFAHGHVWEASSASGGESTVYGEKTIDIWKQLIDVSEDRAQSRVAKIRETLRGAHAMIDADRTLLNRAFGDGTPEMNSALLAAQKAMLMEAKGKTIQMFQSIDAVPFQSDYTKAILYYK